MTPKEVAQVLREIAQLLQLKGENNFKIRAYEAGAEAFEALPPDPAAAGGLNERVRAGTLAELPNVGKAIDQKVSELVQTGHLGYLDDLRKEFPHGALDLVRVPGLGPKRAVTLMRELDIASLDDLAKACQDGRVRGLKGFGEKTEKAILEGLALLAKQSGKTALAKTRPAAERLLERISAAPGVARAAIAGSVRRFAPMNADVDLVAGLSPGATPEGPMEALASAPGVAQVIARGGTKCSVRMHDGLQVDLRTVPDAQFASALHHFTGSKAHHVKLRGLAREAGYSISEYGLAPISPGLSAPQVATEEELYRVLGLSWVPPELREDLGEVELARAGKLPHLVAQSDIRGMVHCHTTWSDGGHSIEEMARAAEALGMEFITISDHSQAAHYAGGLDPERLKAQWDEIAAVQERVKIRILRGSEVDILEDGRLDLPDATLEQLDVVIASVHQRHKLDEAAQTARVRAALSHPLCSIWGHPTGRRLSDHRPETPMRYEELIDVAIERGVTIECNGSPERLDLPWNLLRRAVQAGAQVSCSVDAHSVADLRNLSYAIGTARRGWVTPDRVVNARPPQAFLSAVRRAR